MSVAVRGARVLVTGATGGLGQAIARDLSRRGASLVLTGRRADVLEPLAAELGADAEIVDLADHAAVDALAERCAAVDVFVSNAGLPGSGTLDGFTPEQVDRVLDINLRAPMHLTQALVPGMTARGRGALVFVSSLLGKVATPGSAVYGATKAGLREFALALRADLHGTGVGVTVVNPGFIRDAGMFAEAGVELPFGVGTKPPSAVTAAVVRGIERSPAEIDVAPAHLRAGALVASVAPGVAQAVMRRLGADEISGELSAGQASKR